METKLTLKIREDVARRAKKYATDKKISLSQLIENYLTSLPQKEEDEFQISPFVRSISSGKHIPSNVDSKKEYIDYLDAKYR